MAATQVETLTNPRDSLPNVYTNIAAREMDFATVFTNDWTALRQIMGVIRPIRKAPGTQLVSYSASVALESGDVGPGHVIPYSKTKVEKKTFEDLTIKKYAYAVPIEDVSKYSADIAIEKSDEAFRTELIYTVLGDFYKFLNTGSLTETANTWQMGLAKAQGLVLNKFSSMRKNVTSIVGFANILDAYDYLGTADITTQREMGLTYIQNFLGYSTLFLLPETLGQTSDGEPIPGVSPGKILATPSENIDNYYIDPGDSEFARLGLNYTTVDSETRLIGFHAQGNYNTAVGETYAIMGMKLWAEYLDGIANITVGG